ncbi:hypothetical protein KC573_03700, partial [candidate division WWE3 bacterium]|nr:hypothetical protein [candidate division WWE3 bacterium]
MQRVDFPLPRNNSNQQGAILVITAIILASVIALAGFLWERVGGFIYTQGKSILEEKVLAITEGGIDKAIWELNESATYSGESGTSLGDGTFDVVVTEIDDSTRLVSSTGYIPNAVFPIAQKTVEVEVLNSGTITGFPYGLQAGEDGVGIRQNVIIQGSMYSNGSVYVDAGSSITGDVWVGGNQTSGILAAFENQNSIYRFGDHYTRRDVGISFISGGTSSLPQVQIYLRKVGNPNHLRVRIMTDNGGFPGTTEIGNGVMYSSWVTTSLSWVTVDLSSVPSLIMGQKYWIVLDGGSNS